jgi:hypothetical protein
VDRHRVLQRPEAGHTRPIKNFTSCYLKDAKSLGFRQTLHYCLGIVRMKNLFVRLWALLVYIEPFVRPAALTPHCRSEVTLPCISVKSILSAPPLSPCRPPALPPPGGLSAPDRELRAGPSWGRLCSPRGPRFQPPPPKPVSVYALHAFLPWQEAGRGVRYLVPEPAVPLER